VPIKQRECLEYLGAVEEAMVAGLDFDVPKEYANRPLLKVGPASKGWEAARGERGDSHTAGGGRCAGHPRKTRLKTMCPGWGCARPLAPALA
jgi:hypothetical protein